MIESAVGYKARQILQVLGIVSPVAGEYHGVDEQCVVEFNYNKLDGQKTITAFGDGASVIIVEDGIGNLRVFETDWRAKTQTVTFVDKFGSGAHVLTQGFHKVTGVMTGPIKSVKPENGAGMATEIRERARRVFDMIEKSHIP